MRFPPIAVVLCCAGIIVASSNPAHAQATRTWVSGVGDDANPCSRTAPCKTFAGAISKTAVNGIINCIDPGGFGAITITKSITLDCTGTFGGILGFGTNGVIINAAGINVTLRNLSIEGAGAGLVGVNILNANTVHIENCHIHGFQAGTAAGVLVGTSANVEVTIANTLITENGSGGTGAGILVKTTGAGGGRVVVDRVRSNNNAAGIFADVSGATGRIFMSVAESVMFANTGDGLTALSTAAGANVDVSIRGSVLSGNTGNAIEANGTKATVLVGGSVITANNVGVQLSNGGRIFTFANNQISDNIGGNGTFTGTVPLQ